MTMSTSTFTIESVRWDDPRAAALRDAMNVEMSVRYHRHEPEPADVVERRDRALSVDPLRVFATVIAVEPDGTAIGHAAVRDLGGEWEVKRVIVDAGYRGRGVGRHLMMRLEEIARAAGAPRIILQTGDRQPEAVTLYERIGYTPIPIYEPYIETIPFSLCYEKVLRGDQSVTR